MSNILYNKNSTIILTNLHKIVNKIIKNIVFFVVENKNDAIGFMGLNYDVPLYTRCDIMKILMI